MVLEGGRGPAVPTVEGSSGAVRTQAKAQDEDRELTLADVKGSNTDPAWKEVPEDLYFVANYAAALGGDYPPGQSEGLGGLGVWRRVVERWGRVLVG